MFVCEIILFFKDYILTLIIGIKSIKIYMTFSSSETEVKDVVNKGPPAKCRECKQLIDGDLIMFPGATDDAVSKIGTPFQLIS